MMSIMVYFVVICSYCVCFAWLYVDAFVGDERLWFPRYDSLSSIMTNIYKRMNVRDLRAVFFWHVPNDSPVASLRADYLIVLRFEYQVVSKGSPEYNDPWGPSHPEGRS